MFTHACCFCATTTEPTVQQQKFLSVARNILNLNSFANFTLKCENSGLCSSTLLSKTEKTTMRECKMIQIAFQNHL